MNSVEELVAHTLQISIDRVADSLEYQSVREWDSLGHVALMVAVEQAYGTEVDDELTLELRSVAAIKEFVARDGDRTPASSPAAESSMIRRGLEDITFDRTAITHTDGTAGVLEYRGYSIHDLAGQASYEDVAHLLVHGELPDETARTAFAKELAAGRELPSPVLDLVRSLRHAHPMVALRTAVSALIAYGAQPITGQEARHESA